MFPVVPQGTRVAAGCWPRSCFGLLSWICGPCSFFVFGGTVSRSYYKAVAEGLL